MCPARTLILARVEDRSSQKHPMKGFLPVSLPTVWAPALSEIAARSLSSPPPEVLRVVELTHASSTSHSKHSRVKRRRRQLKAAILPQLKQSPELEMEGSGQSLANYPIYFQWAAAMQKKKNPTNTSVFRNNWMFLRITRNDAQLHYYVTLVWRFVFSSSVCKPEPCFVSRRHLQN